MCERIRFTIRTSDEIINRIEALSGISGEPKNAVANVLLAMSLGGTVGAKPKKAKGESNSSEGEENSMVQHDGDSNSSEKVGAKRKKRVSPPTPPSQSSLI